MSFIYNYLFAKQPADEMPALIEDEIPTATIPEFSYHIEGEDDDDSVASFGLEIEGGIKIHIVLFEPTSDYLKSDWEKLFEVDPTTTITMCDSNGEVAIKVDLDVTKFTVSKHGAGGDGGITVSIPNTITLPVLKEFYITWTERQAKFKSDNQSNC